MRKFPGRQRRGRSCGRRSACRAASACVRGCSRRGARVTIAASAHIELLTCRNVGDAALELRDAASRGLATGPPGTLRDVAGVVGMISLPD